MTSQENASPQRGELGRGVVASAAATRPARAHPATAAAAAGATGAGTASASRRDAAALRPRSVEPLLWLAFSAGGVLAALLIPSLLFLFGVAFPLGWIAPPDHARLIAVLGHPLVRLAAFLLCSLSLAHWAHRFRYTLYDGLQIKHLNELVNVFCYGSAVVGSIIAAYLLLRLP